MKRLLTTIIVLIAVVATGIAIAAHQFIHPDDVRRHLIASVEQESGRHLQIGTLELSVLPWPSLRARDVVLSNPDGFAQGQMVSVREMRASLSPWLLLAHRLRLENVTLVAPHIWLARIADGAANWCFTARPAAAAVQEEARGGALHHAAWHVEIGSARILDGTLGWQDSLAALSGSVAIDQLDLDGLTSAQPWITLHGHRGRSPFTLGGHIGTLDFANAPEGPWPVSLAMTLGAEGVSQDRLALDGQIADVAHGKGLALTVHGNVADLRDAEGLFPHANLPAMQGIAGSVGIFGDLAALGDAPETTDLSGLSQSLHIGAVHLTVEAADLPHDLGLRQMALDAPSQAQPLTIVGQLVHARRTWHVNAHLGTLAAAEQAARSMFGTPLPVTVVLTAIDGTLDVHGTLGGDHTALDIAGHAPELVTDRVTLHDLALRGHLQSGENGALSASDVVISSREAALDGDLAWVPGTPRGRLAGAVHAASIDVDALHDVIFSDRLPWRIAAPTTVKPAPAQVVPSVTPTATPAPAATSDASGTVAALAPSQPAIVRTLLRQDADLKLAVDHLQYRHIVYANVSAHVVLQNGHLQVDPIAGQGPDTQLAGSLAYDVSQDPARFSVAFSPLVLPSSVVQQFLNMPAVLSGPIEFVGALEGQGVEIGTLRDSLHGHLGASIVDGHVSARALNDLTGRKIGFSFGGSDLPLRCFGVHMQLGNGRATLDTLGLATPQISLTGTGSIGLADQSLALDLRPTIGLGGADASAPVSVGGTIAAPQASLGHDPDGRFNLTLGGAQATDPCGAVLAAAREGIAGAQPSAAPPPHHSRAGDILRALGLFH